MVIGVLYYRREIRQFLHSPFQKKNLSSNQDNAAQQDQDLFTATQNLRDEVSQLLTGFGTNLNREELITGLQLKLKNQDKIKGTAFQDAVNNYISTEAESKCSIRLTDQELDRLWVK
jgi:hypothetical protein